MNAFVDLRISTHMQLKIVTFCSNVVIRLSHQEFLMKDYYDE